MLEEDEELLVWGGPVTIPVEPEAGEEFPDGEELSDGEELPDGVPVTTLLPVELPGEETPGEGDPVEVPGAVAPGVLPEEPPDGEEAFPV